MRFTRCASILAIVGSAALARCSNSPSAGDAGSDGGPGSDATVDATSDGSEEASSTDAGSDVVYVGSICFDQASNAYTVQAAFWPGSLGGAAFGCVFSAGPPPGGDAGLASVLCVSQTPHVSAGTLTLTDGTSTLAALAPNWTTYAPATNPPTASLAWDGGDVVMVSASGDTVHAFTGSLPTAPPFENVNPALSQGSPVSVQRSSDFTITWTPSGVNGASVAIVLAGAGGHIVCGADDSSGTATVSHTQLQNFAASESGTITLFRLDEREATGDNAKVDLFSTGTAYGGSATFE